MILFQVVVHNNNIYLYTQRGELKHTLTATGSDNFLNGVPDMTYEGKDAV